MYWKNMFAGVFMMFPGFDSFSLTRAEIQFSQNEVVLVGAGKSSNCGSHFPLIWLPPSTGLTTSRNVETEFLTKSRPLLTLPPRLKYWLFHCCLCVTRSTALTYSTWSTGGVRMTCLPELCFVCLGCKIGVGVQTIMSVNDYFCGFPLQTSGSFQ